MSSPKQDEKQSPAPEQGNDNNKTAAGTPKVKGLSEVFSIAGEKALKGGLPGFMAMGIQGKNYW